MLCCARVEAAFGPFGWAVPQPMTTRELRLGRPPSAGRRVIGGFGGARSPCGRWVVAPPAPCFGIVPDGTVGMNDTLPLAALRRQPAEVLQPDVDLTQTVRRRLVEGAAGRRPHDTVDGEAVTPLEKLHPLLQRLAEIVGIFRHPGGRRPRGPGADSRAGIGRGEHQLGLAPLAGAARVERRGGGHTRKVA